MASLREKLFTNSRIAINDAIAGLLASVVLIANIVSFGALMFPGELSIGVPTAVWAMLIGGCTGGVWIALKTSLPPIATGIDSPTATVLVLLSATAGSAVLKSGGSADVAVETVMLIFTVATFLCGVVLFALGAIHWGSYFRFVPYFVVGGFLSATGCFLIAGGIRMTSGRALSVDNLLAPWTLGDIAKLMSALGVLVALLVMRRRAKSPFAIPIMLLAMWLIGTLALRGLGFSDPRYGWYFHSLGALASWSPFEAIHTSTLTWKMVLELIPELLAVAIVSLISIVTKVSSIEVTRQTNGDLNNEFRAHGIGSLIAAPLGGITNALQTGTSQLLEQAGGATRFSGVFSALALGTVAIANFDLPGLIPIPIVAGLIFSLGYTFLFDALWRPYAQRAWFDLGLALAIMLVCLAYGYLIGVLAGIIGACLLFAISYARVGVVRRHVSRAQFAGYVNRPIEIANYLQREGEAIHIYWLSGYMFFGSSEGVFERIRSDIESLNPGRVAYVVLDFSAVSSADSSAVVSLVKLRNFCEARAITLVYSALSPLIRAALTANSFFGKNSSHRSVENLGIGLAWCEDQLIAKANLDKKIGIDGFEAWLQVQLSPNVRAKDLMFYFVKKDAQASEILYRQGDPADTVDLVAIGIVGIDIAKSEGENLRVRTVTAHTVVGEMGFFRHSARSATVTSVGPATVFTLTRSNFERMQKERPDVALAFCEYILRVLADRVDSANLETLTLIH